MQMILAENLALTFASDAYVLATGFAKILVRIVTLPRRSDANACWIA